MSSSPKPDTDSTEIFLRVEIYAFSGKLGTGKDYLATAFNNMLPPRPTMFCALADTLKIMTYAQTAFRYHNIFGDKTEETRKALQIIGNEQGRLKYGDNVWVRALCATMRSQYERSGIRRFIITDVRFQNELDWVQSIGGIVFRVVAPQRNITRVEKEATTTEAMNAIMSHASEVGLDATPLEQFNYVLHNDYYDNRGMLLLQGIAGNIRRKTIMSGKNKNIMYAIVSIFTVGWILGMITRMLFNYTIT
jgi:hypothetical protein